jgi:pimeloyl-ACP methyl ester carboxylesterase
VAEAGEGPPVVCLHGWPQNWWVFRSLLTGLASSRRVICPDLRGYGWSEAPRSGYEKEQFASDLLALLDALGIERAGLVGHDWGGIAGFLACLRAPERFERFLALNCGHPFPSPSPRNLLSLWRFAYQPLAGAPLLGPALARRALPQAVARLGTRGSWTAQDREIYLGPFRERARARAASLTYRAFITREAPAWAAGRYRDRRVEVPVLMLHGAADLAIAPRMLDGLSEHAPESEIEVVPGVGHFILDEAPELVLERARALFAA